MHIAAIIQARTSSQRLHGKMLMKIGQKTLLEQVITRVSQARLLDTVIVATSDEKSDDQLSELCDSINIPCYRGSLENVALRMTQAAEAYQISAFVRVNGDSPIIDYRLIDRGLQLFKDHNPDLVSNVVQRSFPKGQSVEVVKVRAMRKILETTCDPQDLEHVTRFIYANRDMFRIYSFQNDQDLSAIQMSVDELQDFIRVKTIFGQLAPDISFSLEEIEAIYRSNGWV